ncbi:hypothetical protein [Massilia sp.]|uniref:hypothetical protein n=1 Tax=Massilia sp. TaxID=1882437 RepID=UPI00352F32D6
MAIIRAAVGDALQEFSEGAGFDEVWRFIDKHMASSDVERAIVLMDQGGATIEEIWDSSLYFAHWETPSKMRAYLDLAGFDQDE